MRAAGFAAAVAVLPLIASPADAADVRVGVGSTIGSTGPRYAAQGYGYSYGRRPVDTQRYGFDRGRDEGARDGFKDGERGRRFELYREGDYRDADKGYKGWMGPRWEYARGYQSGYQQGYRQAFDQGRRKRAYASHRHDEHCRHGQDDRYDDDVIHEVPRRW